MNCQQCKPLIQDALDGRLSLEDEAALQDHLKQCPTCREESEKFQKTMALVRSVPEEAPPIGFADRVMAAVDREAPLAKKRAFPWTVFGTVGALAAGVLVFMIFIRQNDVRERQSSIGGSFEVASEQAAPPEEKSNLAKKPLVQETSEADESSTADLLTQRKQNVELGVAGSGGATESVPLPGPTTGAAPSGPRRKMIQDEKRQTAPVSLLTEDSRQFFRQDYQHRFLKFTDENRGAKEAPVLDIPVRYLVVQSAHETVFSSAVANEPAGEIQSVSEDSVDFFLGRGGQSSSATKDEKTAEKLKIPPGAKLYRFTLKPEQLESFQKSLARFQSEEISIAQLFSQKGKQDKISESENLGAFGRARKAGPSAVEIVLLFYPDPAQSPVEQKTAEPEKKKSGD